VALGSAGSVVAVCPAGSAWVNTAREPWATSSLSGRPERLDTDSWTLVWPPIATLGGVRVPPAPIFSATTKCGVDSGGWVWVWCAGLVVLVLEAVALDALRVVEAELDELDEGDEDDEDALLELAGAAALEDRDELVEVEWLPDPHAATSSAVTSAAAARLTIGSA